MAGDFDAYHKWLSIPPHEQPPHHYRLLAVNLFEDDLDVIENAADRQMKHLRDFQSGKHAELSQKLLNEIAAARHCLLDPQRKAAYDAQLRQREQAKRPEQPLRQPLPTKQQNPSASGVGKQGSTKPANPAATFKSATPESLSPVRKRTPAANVSPVLLLAAIGPGILLLLVAVALGVFYLGGSSPPVQPDVAGLNPPQALVDPVGAIDPLPSDNPPHSHLPATDPVSNPPTPVDPPSTENPPADPEPATPTQPEPRDTITPTTDDPQPPKRSPIDALFAAAEEDTRTPVPGAEARATKAKQIEVLFPADNARTYAQKLNLVQQLLKTARDTKSDADAQYMLLETARDVARTTGNIAVAFEAIDALEEQFQIDGPAMRAESLIEAAKAASPLSLKAQVIDEGVKVVDVLFEQDRYAEAATLIGSLRALARKTRDKDRLATVGARQEQSSELLQRFKAVQPAIDALKANPEDTAAATTAGKFHAFIKGDWQRGLVMLSVSSDEALKKLAQQEMAVPTSHDDQKTLADGWLKQASTAKGLEAERQRARAAMWYTKVQSELTGLSKVVVQKKLSAIGKLNVDGGDVFEPPPELVATLDDAPPSTPSSSSGSLSPVDLLALIDVKKDVTRGSWQMQDGKLISPNMTFATVQIPYCPPQEYIVEAVVSSPNQGCDLAMGLVRDGRHFQIVTEGYGGQWSGINVLDQRLLPNGNPTAREGRLTHDNEPSRIVYRVTRGRIQLTCDGEMIAEFDGGSSRLHAHGGFKVVNPMALYLGVCDRELTIHSLKLVPLSGQGRPTRDERGVPLPVQATLPEGETATFIVGAQAQGLEARPFEDDGPFTVSTIDGKAALTASDWFVYFHVDDAFAFDLPRRSKDKFYAVVTVLDKTEGEIYVQYDAHASVWTSTPRADVLGTGNWKEIAFELPGARLANRQNNSADFRVACNFKGVVVHKMELRRCKAASGTEDSDPGRDAAGNLWTAAAGGTGGSAYEDTFGRPDAQLVGLNVGWSQAVIESIEPVYSTSKGVQLGQFVGETLGTTDMAKLVAKEGYAVGGLVVNAGDYVDGLQLIFMRQRGDVLDPKDSYTSEWLGSRGGSETRLGGTGDPVIGIHGRAGTWMDSVGLIIRDSTRSP